MVNDDIARSKPRIAFISGGVVGFIIVLLFCRVPGCAISGATGGAPFCVLKSVAFSIQGFGHPSDNSLNAGNADLHKFHLGRKVIIVAHVFVRMQYNLCMIVFVLADTCGQK